jgi:hypothetical protein
VVEAKKEAKRKRELQKEAKERELERKSSKYRGVHWDK